MNLFNKLLLFIGLLTYSHADLTIAYGSQSGTLTKSIS